MANVKEDTTLPFVVLCLCALCKASDKLSFKGPPLHTNFNPKIAGSHYPVTSCIVLKR